MRVLAHLRTASAAAQPATAAAAPTGTAAAAVLQDLVWNSLILEEKLTQLVPRGWSQASLCTTAPPP